MVRSTALAFSIVLCITSLACQTYTTGLQQSVARADETSAIGALRTIALAQRTYSLSNGGSYASFQQLCDGGYMDSRFNSSKPEVKGYVLTMDVSAKPGSESGFSCNADPLRAGEQAGRHFYIDSLSNEVHVNPTQPATASDPIYQP
jgi:hypothetical protein